LRFGARGIVPPLPPRYAPVQYGACSLWCKKAKAFCERAFALHRQQHGKDKQNIEFTHPGKVSAVAHASDLNFLKILAFFRHVLVATFLQIQPTINLWIIEILINHFFAIFKVSRPETFETETHKHGSRDESRDSITVYLDTIPENYASLDTIPENYACGEENTLRKFGLFL